MTRSLLFLSAYDVLKEGIVALTQVPRPCSANQIVCCRVRMEHCPLPMILMHQSLSCHVVPATPKLRPGRLIYGRLAGCIMRANLEFQTHSNLFFTPPPTLSVFNDTASRRRRRISNTNPSSSDSSPLYKLSCPSRPWHSSSNHLSDTHPCHRPTPKRYRNTQMITIKTQRLMCVIDSRRSRHEHAG